MRVRRVVMAAVLASCLAAGASSVLARDDAVPEAAKALVRTGLVKQAAGDLDAAIADYTRAIELSPRYALAYYDRGTAERAKR